MKFTVDIEDFYLEEEEITEALKNFIRGDITAQINQVIKAKTIALVESIIAEEVREKLETRVNTLVNEVSANHKIKGRYSTDPEQSIAEYIGSVFNEVNLQKKGAEMVEKTVKEHVLKASEKLSNDLKNRYDMLFASQIVQRLNENQMLRSDVASLLIPKGE